MTYQQGVYKRYHSGDKHFSEFYLQDGGKNHVIRTEWRSYRDHRLCDVTSPCVFSKRDRCNVASCDYVELFSSLHFSSCAVNKR